MELGPLGVGVGQRPLIALVLGQLVEHRQILEPAAQLLQPAQLALRVREPAGDLLRGIGVVPEIGLSGLVGEVRDLDAQRGQVGDRLDALQRGGKVLQVGCGVGIHNFSDYASTPAAHASVGIESSSLTIARRCDTAKSATALR